MSIVDVASRIGGIEQQIERLRSRPPAPGRFEHVLRQAMGSAGSEAGSVPAGATGGTSLDTNPAPGLIGMLGTQVRALGTASVGRWPAFVIATPTLIWPPVCLSSLFRLLDRISVIAVWFSLACCSVQLCDCPYEPVTVAVQPRL